MIITGTAHFVSFAKACDYYRDYYPGKSRAYVAVSVQRKLQEGEIHIGKPMIAETGQRLILIDRGCRYAIEG